ncbi:MAG TPA: cytochrome D1 domain-containing protein [Bryobacteraceae bacterium]|nr:cytochrome D1 domain-containing protein [Bryobacteraceae bacterium]
MSSRGIRILVLVIVIVVLIAGAFSWTRYIRIPTNVAYVTSQDGGISVIDLNSLDVVKQVFPPNVAPRGLGLTFNGEYLMTANENTADATVFDTRGMRIKLVKRMHVGDNPEFVKINPSGTEMFTSFEPGSTGGPPTPGEEEGGAEEEGLPAQVVAFSTRNWSQVISFAAGPSTEGLEFSADGSKLLVANEDQNTVGVYDTATGKRIDLIDLSKIGRRPRGIKRSPLGAGYAVTMEGSGTLVMLDPNFNVVRTIQTEAKPYGVAFDKSGKRLFVAAAAAQKLQVFDADTLKEIGEASIGKRCWHFTFTPDGSKLLLACGRSDDVYVVDANTYKVIKTIGGFQTPWGILTYPRSYGSLGLP